MGAQTRVANDVSISAARSVVYASGTNATDRHVHSTVCFRGKELTRYARFKFFAF